MEPPSHHARPPSPASAGRALWPFFAAGVVSFGAAPLTEGRNDYPTLLLGVALLVVLALATVLLPWARVPRRAHVLPPLGLFVVVVLLRDGAGGSMSGYSALVLLPILWLALYGTRGELLLGFAAMAVTLSAPVLLVGAPEYPPSEWRRLLVWVLLAPIAGVTVHRLIDERSRLLVQVHRLSLTDALTGVANRRGWDVAAGDMLARARRTGAPVAVAVLDLDHFKRFNDQLGHHAGDQLLKAAVAAWQSHLRPGDVLARCGGEEFLVMLDACPRAEAKVIVDRLRAATPLNQTCSAGVALSDATEPAEATVMRADAALYAAKRAGRDRTVMAGDAPGSRLPSRRP